MKLQGIKDFSKALKNYFRGNRDHIQRDNDNPNCGHLISNNRCKK